MAKASPIITNFASGELSDRLEGRVDIPQYFNSCRILENMLITAHGNAERTPGTALATSSKDSTKISRLIPYEKDPDNLYVCEFGDQYIRFCKDHEQIESGGSPYEIASPYLEANLNKLRLYQIENSLYIVHPSYAPMKLICTTDTSWALTAVNFSGWDESTVKNITGATQAAPIVITAAAHGFINGDIILIRDMEVTVTSLANKMGLGMSSFLKEIKIIAGMPELNSCPFEVANKTADTFQLKGTDGTTYKDYVSGGTVRKKGVLFNSADNYPACIGSFEGRLVLASTNNNPNGIWLSKSSDVEDFCFGVNDGDAIELLVKTKNRIRWIIGKEAIMFGTGSDEWSLSGNGNLITPTNFSVKRQSQNGSADLPSEIVGSNIFYTQKAGKRIREYYYTQESNNYISPDLTILAEHITESGIACYALQTNPNTIFWCVRNDGVLIGLTYDRMYNVVGWHRHITDGEVESIAVIPKTDEDEIWIIVKREIDGQTKRYIEYFKPRDFGSDQADCFYVHCGLTFDGGSAKDITGATQAKPVVISSTAHGFENDQLVQITGVEGMTELNDGVYMVKNKTADTFELYLEDESDELDGTGFTAYTSAGTVQQVFKTLTGLDHLEGKTVSILGDGATQPDKTVESGEITLKYYSNKVHVGLPYTSKLKPQRLEAGSADGTSQGKTKRINRITVRYRLTNSCKIGTDEDHLEEILFREGTALMGTPTPLYSGDQEISFPGGYEKEGNIMIVQDKPLPLCVVAIMPRVRTND